ncbi:GNAT family N-acetyltransferase [Streptomyces qinglanensis]|uniref:GNAT family N-acetyltransferase n=1 Tax=Streptomyces qinglanensis TaxID=943816 RepID=UPI0037A4B87F
MTTTLRPTGPESRPPEGGRARAYEIRVNSRPVGTVHLSRAPEDGPALGRLRLYVEPAERRRGRGAVAALAAEEVLRGWGCTRVEASVPLTADAEAPAGAEAPADAEAGGERAPAGVRLLAALGYAERSSHLTKPLHARPALPTGRAIRPLADAEFDAWWEEGAATFVAGLVEQGHSREQALARSTAVRRTHLPDGAASAGAALRVLTCEGTAVGAIWLGFTGLPRSDVHAWVYDVRVLPGRRGEGHGRALMLAAESVCLDAGAECLGLNVFAGNTPARRLYGSLGYRTVERHYLKTLL